MTHRAHNIAMRSEAEARDIVAASNSHVHASIRRGIMERWLSYVVRYLNALDGQPATRELARARCDALVFQPREVSAGGARRT
jgi:hypothetical protein